MPKQIKKREFTKGEKAECLIALIAMAVGLCFAGAFIVMIPDIENDSEKIQFATSIVAAVSYVYGPCRYRGNSRICRLSQM